MNGKKETAIRKSKGRVFCRYLYFIYFSSLTYNKGPKSKFITHESLRVQHTKNYIYL